MNANCLTPKPLGVTSGIIFFNTQRASLIHSRIGGRKEVYTIYVAFHRRLQSHAHFTDFDTKGSYYYLVNYNLIIILYIF